MTVHDFRAGEDDGGWDIPTCGCGWTGPPAPDIETAADMWGDHLVAAVNSNWVEAQNKLSNLVDKSREEYDALAEGLLAVLYPDTDPLADHASGPADLLPLLEDTGQRQQTIDGYERALLLGPPYKVEVSS